MRTTNDGPNGRRSRTASNTIAPFATLLTQWQEQFEHLKGIKSAPEANKEQQAQARDELSKLVETVATSRLEYEQAISNLPARGEVLEIRRALLQLMKQIGEELRG